MIVTLFKPSPGYWVLWNGNIFSIADDDDNDDCEDKDNNNNGHNNNNNNGENNTYDNNNTIFLWGEGKLVWLMKCSYLKINNN